MSYPLYYLSGSNILYYFWGFKGERLGISLIFTSFLSLLYLVLSQPIFWSEGMALEFKAVKNIPCYLKFIKDKYSLDIPFHEISYTSEFQNLIFKNIGALWHIWFACKITAETNDYSLGYLNSKYLFLKDLYAGLLGIYVGFQWFSFLFQDVLFQYLQLVERISKALILFLRAQRL